MWLPSLPREAPSSPACSEVRAPTRDAPTDGSMPPGAAVPPSSPARPRTNRDKFCRGNPCGCPLCPGKRPRRPPVRRFGRPQGTPLQTGRCRLAPLCRRRHRHAPERTAISSVGATLVVALFAPGGPTSPACSEVRAPTRDAPTDGSMPPGAAVPPSSPARPRTNRDNFCRGNPCGCPLRPGRRPRRPPFHAAPAPPLIGETRRRTATAAMPCPGRPNRRARTCSGHPCSVTFPGPAPDVFRHAGRESAHRVDRRKPDAAFLSLGDGA